MWFRKLRSRRDPEARGGVAIAPRRSQNFGPRVVEALEDRALMSMGGHGHHMPPPPHTSFMQTNLVSDLPDVAQVQDMSLVNPWGLVASPSSPSSPAGSPWWVNDNGTGVSTLYNGSGVKQPLEVTIPPPTGGTPPSAPTGIVFNGNQHEFFVSPNTPAHFIFATEDGTIAGWNSGNTAATKVDNSGSGAVYKGLALASNGSAHYLYATNFHAGTVDVFDSSFQPVTLGTGAFTGTFSDPHIPTGFAPFGIAAIMPPGASKEFLVVTYAKQDADKHDDVAGPGNGFVDIFDTSGDLIRRVASHGTLNSPWGVAVAPPSNFGSFSGDLLIGNFGDGRINAFKFPDELVEDHAGRGRSAEAHRFQFDGRLRDLQRRPITIDGLWSLAFGNGGNAGPTTTLFFTAGPGGEAHGLFGSLTVASK